MDPITLRKDEQGNTVLVKISTTEITTPLSSEELIRQINEHSAVINQLQCQLEAVLAFEKSSKVEQVSEMKATPLNPIINKVTLESVTATIENSISKEKEISDATTD